MNKLSSDELSSSEQVKLNYLFLFRKVLLTQCDESQEQVQQKERNIGQFLPQIVQTLESSQNQDASRKVIVECLLLLNELRSLHPNLLSLACTKSVLRMANKLKGHKKRVVRTVARTTINDWSLAD